MLYGASPHITPGFAQTGSAEELATAYEAYEQLLQAFEANRENLSDRDYARQLVELAVALAAIHTLEAKLASAAGQSYDLSAAINAYQVAFNLVAAMASHLNAYQQAYAMLVLRIIAETITDLGGSF